MKFKLPKVSYQYSDLEPYIDAQTMEIHHSKHHQGYVNKLNQALEKHPQLAKQSIKDLLRNISNLPQEIRLAVKNNGGGHYNHSLFWQIMKPGGPKQPQGTLKEQINKEFGDFKNFKQQFSQAAASHFGSGWAWLTKAADRLKLVTTANQDSPISSNQTPLLGLDVWEHAYYLKYQNRRPDYISAWWHVVNWQQVEKNFNNA